MVFLLNFSTQAKGRVICLLLVIFIGRDLVLLSSRSKMLAFEINDCPPEVLRSTTNILKKTVIVTAT